MAWYWTIIIGLIFFTGGLILGFFLATKWIDPGDEINVKKAKAKKGILKLNNIFNRKKQKS